MRLIDADAQIRKLCAERDEVQIEHACDIGYHNGLNMAVSMTINAPAIDPESLRPQGEWVQIGYDELMDRITCSNCKECWNILDNDTETFNYCPNCGAKMKGGTP